ncbi:MAG: FAD-dependent monooxygenase [Egibacteraceae bacterium]
MNSHEEVTIETTAVMIVGAGPTGLALACGLLGSGVPVRVVDCACGPAVTSRALGLQPRGVEVLDRLGALGDLPQRGLPIGEVVVNVNDRQVARLSLGRPTRLVTRPGLLISQAEIEAGLRRRLEGLGTVVEWGREMLDADQDPDGVTVRLDGGDTIRAAWLVGCDGAHSRVRKVAGIGFPGVPLVERFLLADVHVDLPLPRDAVSVWLHGEDMVGAFPLPGADLWRVMMPAPAGVAEDLPPEGVLALITQLWEKRTGYAARRVRSAEWISTFRIHRRLAETYRRGRMLLAGDAAHIHSPFGGQGMNTGIGDAENLAWKLAVVANGRADQALLDSYEAERRPVAVEVLDSTSWLTRLVLGENRVARLLRDHVFVPLMNRPLIQRLIWEQASQLNVTYRGGPLATQSRRRLGDGPRPGDRVPDLVCVRTDGSKTRLHAELGTRWALLGTPSPAIQACAEVVRTKLGLETVTMLAPVDGQPRDTFLVRPDAHLAWRGAPAPEPIEQWLAAALAPEAAG